jgi:very-short-patch-repair endonuclease
MITEEPKELESWAERRFYPYLEWVAKQTGMKLALQQKIMEAELRNWVEELLEEDESFADVIAEHDCEEDGCEGECRFSYEYEKYRLDFVIWDVTLKVDIEVDGQKWHDKEKDRQRDEYLTKRGYHVIRVPAKDVIKKPAEVALRVKNDILFLRWSENKGVSKEAMK